MQRCSHHFLNCALLHELTEVLATVAALAEVLRTRKGNHRLLALLIRSLSRRAGLRTASRDGSGTAVAADDVHPTNVIANDLSNRANEGVSVLVCAGRRKSIFRR